MRREGDERITEEMRREEKRKGYRGDEMRREGDRRITEEMR